MLTKDITYTDLNGNKRTDTYYFNLTKAELVEFSSDYPNGVFEYLSHLMKHADTMQGKLIATFKDLILRSYGERTPEGRFVKSTELREAFAASEAYSELFFEITADQNAAETFINAICPQIPDTKKGNITNLSSIPAPLG